MNYLKLLKATTMTMKSVSINEMTHLEQGKIFGQWKFCEEIGSGGFGLVTSWMNVKTHERLVIKQCRKQLDAKNRMRWVEEISLMNSNHHKNLVSGRSVPDDIQNALIGPEPLLGLEYCGGDLRKVLGNAFNCCGLKENVVLDILRDVSCGLKFLHNKRIVHRDLKPENILFCYNNDSPTYKITDLGYAKQMDHSYCMSFVGTIQYLAPEIYEQNGYDCTADFWSFGTVIFECITGNRPFQLPVLPVKWFQLVKEKGDQQICGYCDDHQEVKFSPDIPQPNNMCNLYIEAFKEWLQLVLHHDPKRRGGEARDGSVECFARIKRILSMNVIHVIDVSSCTDLSYLCKRGETGAHLKRFLETEADISISYQLITDNLGQPVDDESLLECYYQRKTVLYLFHTNKKSGFSSKVVMPQRVRELLGSSEEQRKFDELKRYWAPAVYYCNKCVSDYSGLVYGQRALLLNMIQHCSSETLKENLRKAAIKLETAGRFYEEAYKYDLEFCKPPDQQSIEKQQCLSEWATMSAEVRGFAAEIEISDLLKQLRKIDDKVKSCKEATPKNTSSQDPPGDLEKVAKEAQEKYDLLRRRMMSSNKTEKHDSIKMCDFVMQCMNKFEIKMKDFYINLKQILKVRDELIEITAKMEYRLEKLNGYYERTIQHQRYRQATIWRLFLDEQKYSERSSLSSLVPTLQNLVTSNDCTVTEERCVLVDSLDDHDVKKTIYDTDLKFARLEKLMTDEEEDNRRRKINRLPKFRTLEEPPTQPAPVSHERRNSAPPQLTKIVQEFSPVMPTFREDSRLEEEIPSLPSLLNPGNASDHNGIDLSIPNYIPCSPSNDHSMQSQFINPQSYRHSELNFNTPQPLHQPHENGFHGRHINRDNRPNSHSRDHINLFDNHRMIANDFHGVSPTRDFHGVSPTPHFPGASPTRRQAVLHVYPMSSSGRGHEPPYDGRDRSSPRRNISPCPTETNYSSGRKYLPPQGFGPYEKGGRADDHRHNHPLSRQSQIPDSTHHIYHPHDYYVLEPPRFHEHKTQELLVKSSSHHPSQFGQWYSKPHLTVMALGEQQPSNAPIHAQHLISDKQRHF